MRTIMKSNSPASHKTHFPDSDESARKKHPHTAQPDDDSTTRNLEGSQTSNKSGKHSSVEKLAASRPELGSASGSQPAAGAFGRDESHVVTGRRAGPDTNQYRCSGCGRYFNTGRELSDHETECRSAKAATRSGAESLRHEDAVPHAPNDADSNRQPFQHGTKGNR